MTEQQRSSEEVVRQARDLYERQIRRHVEPEKDGKFLALDIESGDYELASEAFDASTGLRGRKPDAVLYLMRVGRPTAYRLGGRFAGSGAKSAQAE